MDEIDRWFPGWMEYHQKLHPDRRWIAIDAPDAYDFYLGWMEAFSRAGATEALAREASKRLQARKLYLNQHLEALIEAIGTLRKAAVASPAADAPDPGLVAASIASRDCPECAGSGRAGRLMMWRGIRRPFRVVLCCRCPAGRWRVAHDPARATGDRTKLQDDLQAHPELWDATLSHPTWDDVPCENDMEDVPGCVGKWWFVPPGEEAPGPMTAGDLAATLGRGARP